MSDEIPEDVMKAADSAWIEMAGLSTLGREDETKVFARAILAERERSAKIVDGMVDNLYGEPGLQASHERAVLIRAASAIRSSHE